MKAEEYKKATIEACKQLIEKYENPKENVFFDSEYCPLCMIYVSNFLDCEGCFMTNKNGEGGCMAFKSYLEAFRYEGSERCYNNNRKYYYEGQRAYQKRANFFKKIIPYLEKQPAEKFHPDTWTYFDISRDL
jgi:hypothetical protein